MLLRVSGWQALRSATAPLLALGLAVNAILGPNAMSLADLGEMCLQTPSLRLGLYALWALAMAPAARGALFAPGLTYLRGLGMPGALGPAFLASLLLVLQAPITLLLLAAGQAPAALLLAAGLGAGALLLGMPYARGAQLVGMGLVLGSALLVYLGMLWAAAAIGIVLSVWRIPLAWRDAPARAQLRKRRSVVGGPWLALASVMLLHLWRRESPMLVRSALVLLIGAAVILRFAEANPNMDLFVPLLIGTTPFLAMISILVALGVQRSLGGMYWIAASMSVSVLRTLIVSLVLLLLICAAASLALTASILRWDLIAASIPHAVFWGSLASWLASVDPQGSRVSMWFVLIAVVDMLAMAMLGPFALVYEGGLAFFCVARRSAKPRVEPLYA